MHKINFSNKAIFTIIIALFITGCATTEKDWEVAKRDNTVESYKLFTNKHPSSKYLVSAQKNITEIKRKQSWDEAVKKNNIAAYMLFINKYSESDLTIKAINNISTISKKRWKPVTGDDIKLLKDIVSEIKSSYTKYSGNLIYGDEIADQGVTRQIAVLNAIYSSEHNLFYSQNIKAYTKNSQKILGENLLYNEIFYYKK